MANCFRISATPTEVKKLSAESVGQTISLDGFGAKITRHDGVETDLKELVEASGSGVVIFTYPKASTPGCKSNRGKILDSSILITS